MSATEVRVTTEQESRQVAEQARQKEWEGRAFLREIFLGQLPLDLVHPFPTAPERPEFARTLSEKIPYYRQRHCVKPGITGWAQINYKYGDTLEDTISKLEYDLYYIKNVSLSLDAYIIFHTLKTMLLSRGSQ